MFNRAKALFIGLLDVFHSHIVLHIQPSAWPAFGYMPIGAAAVGFIAGSRRFRGFAFDAEIRECASRAIGAIPQRRTQGQGAIGGACNLHT